jgi:hypothetical protein
MVKAYGYGARAQKIYFLPQIFADFFFGKIIEPRIN